MKSITTTTARHKKRVSQGQLGPNTTTLRNSAVAAKWGDAILAGYQLLPDVLLKNQHKSGLTATDLVVLINLTMHWWYPDQRPFPRSHTIANRMGVDVRTIQRTFERLRKLSFVRRVKVGDSNEFDLHGLADRLGQLARDDSSYRSPLGGSSSKNSNEDADVVGFF
jgi:hypothetical protein